jgi:hypothetical protein
MIFSNLKLLQFDVNFETNNFNLECSLTCLDNWKIIYIIKYKTTDGYFNGNKKTIILPNSYYNSTQLNLRISRRVILEVLHYYNLNLKIRMLFTKLINHK